MPSATVKINLERLPAVQHSLRALMRLLHEIEVTDPALIPDGVLAEAANARAVVDEWRQPGRHARRHTRD
jgi:hypothetical protein